MHEEGSRSKVMLGQELSYVRDSDNYYTIEIRARIEFFVKPANE